VNEFGVRTQSLAGRRREPIEQPIGGRHGR
jgi:hypothetical protein